MKAMKTLKTFLLVLGTLLVSSTLYSCLDDDDSYSLGDFSVGVVTVKPLGGDTYYLQLDDSTSLWPSNGVKPYFGLEKERRAFANFTVLGKGQDLNMEYDFVVRVNRIDSVLTKSIAEDLGDKNDEYYGNDPISMKSAWIEDGYITFQFETYFDGITKHFINLVKREGSGPYELEFRHNDFNTNSGGWGWGLASFRLDDLPDTNGETVTMKIKYKDYNGDKDINLKYKSGNSTGKAPMMKIDNFFETK